MNLSHEQEMADYSIGSWIKLEIVTLRSIILLAALLS